MKPKGNDLLILGAGGHGLVVAEAAAASGWNVVGFRDEGKEPGTVIGDWKVLGDLKLSIPPGVSVIVGIGDNRARQRISTEMAEKGVALGTVIHPTAIISPSAHIGDGVFIGPRALVHAEAAVGWGAIVNSAAVVEHHNRIGCFSHVASGAVLAGSVTLGDRVMIGANATVIPGMQICTDCTVGAGAAVVRPLDKAGIYVGVPARLRTS